MMLARLDSLGCVLSVARRVQVIMFARLVCWAVFLVRLAVFKR